MTNWSVVDVDRNTACSKCHTPGLMGTHPRHNAGGNCGAVCHLPNGWGDSSRYAIPGWVGVQGSFAASSSPNAPSSVIHAIHSKPRWMGSVNTASEKCASCHAIADCSACHDYTKVAPKHLNHSASGNASYTAQAPWVGETAHGVIDGNLGIGSVFEVQNQCATVGCHDVAGMATSAPVQRESHSHGPLPASPVTDVVTYSPLATSWKPLSSTFYTLQRAVYANAAGQTLTTVFPAQVVEVVAALDPYYGQAEVWINGTKRADIDLYAPVTGYQKVVYRSGDLGAGNHTVQIRAKGTKNALSRGTYVVIDGFRAYPTASTTVAPQCVSCHADKTPSHGFTFSHVATSTAFSASGNCLRCHEGQNGVATADVRNLYKTNGFGLNVKAHGSCSTCHNGGLNLGGQVDSVTNCVYCHTTGKAGTHVYTPYDPNHYYASSHDSSLTATANYGTTSYGKTLTNYLGTSLNFERSCTGCHSIDLKTEHDKTTVAGFASVPGTHNDRCVACHELKVDNWAARWTGSCAGEASSCHSLGNLHSDWGTKHDAGAGTIASPGNAWIAASASTGQNVVSQDFGTTTTWSATDWTRESPTYVRSSTTRRQAGASAEIWTDETRTDATRHRTYGFLKDIDLSYATGTATLTYWRQVTGFANGGDSARVEYSINGGTSYTTLWSTTTNVTEGTNTHSIPAGGMVRLRFAGTINNTTEYVNFDTILLTANVRTPGGWGAALPANSTITASCSNNPNATQCHNVTDVANIHSNIVGRTDSGCPICHKSSSQPAATTDCDSSGCHDTVGINGSGHDTGWHESTFSNTTLFGTGFAPSWCNGCHDDSIAKEHYVLGAYNANPCSTCHKKVTDSGAPTNVTAANTTAAIRGNLTPDNQLCTDCHTTVTKATPHVQRTGWNGLPDTGSAAVGGVQFNNTWSGHRVYDTMPGSKTSFTTAVDGTSASRAWSLPTASNFLASGWTTTSVVRCVDCHGTVTGATGPHGGAMEVRIAAGYTNNYSTGGTYINGTAIGGNGICAKCHQVTNLFNGTANGNVHNRSDHKGVTEGQCINCHVKIPHAWKRPRLIGYTTDPAPYASKMVIRIADRDYTPTGWSASYCYLTACGDHSTNPSPAWP